MYKFSINNTQKVVIRPTEICFFMYAGCQMRASVSTLLLLKMLVDAVLQAAGHMLMLKNDQKMQVKVEKVKVVGKMKENQLNQVNQHSIFIFSLLL